MNLRKVIKVLDFSLTLYTGLEISVQWSKKSGRFEENENR